MMRAFLKISVSLVLGVVMLSASGCGGNMDDLDLYINEIKAKPGGRIDPLPEITPYNVFMYTADAESIRSPFVPDTPQVSSVGGGTRPDRDRSREYLESFSLDTLTMVGTLDMDETNYGLVQAADGLIHRVTIGNYMGQNDGRITEISESEIQLVEIISDGIGGYIERDAAVSLAD